MHRPIALTVLLASLVLIPAMPSGAELEMTLVADPWPATTAYAEVGGQLRPIEVGDVIAEAIQVEKEECLIAAPIVVGAYVPESDAPVAIRWSFDENCRAVVREIGGGPPSSEEGTSVAPVTPAAPEDVELLWRLTDTAQSCITEADSCYPGTPEVEGPDPDHQHKGKAVHTVYEQFDVPATRTTAKMTYRETKFKVYGGSYGACFAWHSDFPVWDVPETRDCGWDPNGPNRVSIRAAFHYKWINPTCVFPCDYPIRYTSVAKFWADSVNRHAWGYVCELKEGSLPILWEDECWGERV